MNNPIIGVAGSGVMGGGIAQMLAEHGFRVVLWDVEKEWAQNGLGKIRKRLSGSVEKGKLAPERAAEIVSLIAVADGVESLAPVGLVIEAIVENPEIKKEFYARLEAVISPEAIIGTNTSSLSVMTLAAGLVRPERFLGIHFFNPPTKLELVELILTPILRPEVKTRVNAILDACGKTVVEVRDSPGFIVNRLLLPLINEAAKLLDEGVATPEAIDTAMELGALYPAGPLKVADLVGLDVCKHILEVLQRSTGRADFAPAATINQLVAAGRLGRKSGAGFYQY